MKTMRITDFLTDTQINTAIKLANRIKVRDQIIIPNMETINKKLGQENDPDYLSFVVEYVFTQAGVWR